MKRRADGKASTKATSTSSAREHPFTGRDVLSEDELRRALRADAFIQSDDPEIRKQAEALTGGLDDIDKARALTDWGLRQPREITDALDPERPRSARQTVWEIATSTRSCSRRSPEPSISRRGSPPGSPILEVSSTTMRGLKCGSAGGSPSTRHLGSSRPTPCTCVFSREDSRRSTRSSRF